MKKGHLLIIDDETHLLSVLSFLLGNYAEKVTVAENPSDGLKIIDTEKIDCILCDINLPRMSGLDVLRFIRSAGLDIPFIFFTADSGEEAMMEAARLEATGFFYKPHFNGIEKAVIATLHGNDYAIDPASEFGRILSLYKTSSIPQK